MQCYRPHQLYLSNPLDLVPNMSSNSIHFFFGFWIVFFRFQINKIHNVKTVITIVPQISNNLFLSVVEREMVDNCALGKSQYSWPCVLPYEG